MGPASGSGVGKEAPYTSEATPPSPPPPPSVQGTPPTCVEKVGRLTWREGNARPQGRQSMLAAMVSSNRDRSQICTQPEGSRSGQVNR